MSGKTSSFFQIELKCLFIAKINLIGGLTATEWCMKRL